MGYEERVRQVFILGKSFKLTGAKNDSYFESHIDVDSLSELDVLNLLAASISDDDYVVDVGANIGYTALAMSQLCPNGKVFAFEPGKTMYSLLTKNVTANRLKNVRAFEYGLSDKKQSVELSYNTTHLAGAFIGDTKGTKELQGSIAQMAGAYVNPGVDDTDTFASDTIELRRLDDEYKKIGISKCAVLKIDVEGHEPNFLRGARGFINKFKPTVIMEVNHWCLNVFNRTSLPDFIDASFELFPFMFAFHDGNYLDLSDENARSRFYYENVIKHSYFNVFCGFDRNAMIRMLNLAFGGWEIAGQSLAGKQALEQQVAALNEQVQNLESQIAHLRNSRPQKAAAKINKLIGR